MSKAIEIDNLKFTYSDGTQALKGISFCVEEGECVGVIGSNGAGKTTLLLHLNGILKGEGSVRIYDHEISDDNLPFIRNKVGLVFQDPDSQLFMPTVFDDVAFGPINMVLKPEEVERRVTKALSDVDMSASGDRISHHLSFGEKKRISLATVLSMEPEILVLDEPTSNLDPVHRSQLIKILKVVGGTKIIGSHDIDMISRLTTRVVVLKQGEVAAIGPTRQILETLGFLKEFGFYS